ncbi:MAG: oligosaccharide flippase family protein [Gemmatimonadetes bacterium]|nr:oligosaccharide flippase family protein [Gemmatimonadota bacterium]
MTRTQRFLGGLTLGYANQALVTLVGLWLTAFLLRTLGQRDYGLWLVATQILGYLLLADLGVVAMLPRETAYATGRAGGSREAAELPDLVGQTARLVGWQLPVVAVAAALIWMLLPVEWQPLRKPLALVFAVFVATFPLRLLQAVLQGLQDLTFLGAAQMVVWAAGTTATVLLAMAGFGLYALIVGWIVNQILSVAISWWRVRTTFPQVLPRKLPRVSLAQARAYLSRSIWVSLAQVAQVFLNGSDVLIIGKVLGPAAAVPYFCTAKLVTVLANQPQMVMQSAAPALSELRTGESRERLLRVCTALTEAMLMVSGAVACVVIAVNQGFVRWWVGAGQYGGFALTAALVALMLLRHWNTTAVYAIFAFGYERRISLTTLADGLLTIAVAVLLIPRFGVIGAPIASLTGVCLVSLPANLAALARETGLPALKLIAQLRHWLWRFLLALAVAKAISPFVAPGKLYALVAGTLAIGLLYATLMVPLALRDPLGSYVRPRLDALRTRWLKPSAGRADA